MNKLMRGSAFGCGILASLLTIVAAACEAPRPSPGPTSSPMPTMNSRLGTYPIVDQHDQIIGTFAAEHDGGAITLRISIELGHEPHPWGIFEQDACTPPESDRDAPFQFADIEGGQRTEQVEAQAYLGHGPNLVLIVFSPNAADLAGCVNLGPPMTAAQTDPAPSCDGVAEPTDAAPPLLAFAREVLSNSDIYVGSGNDDDARRLTNATAVDMKPSWSPDGTQIAFRTSRDGQDEIYVMRADGSCQVNLTRAPGDDRSPAWSPDACEIAFERFFDPRFQDIAVMDANGNDARRLTRASGEYPSWSPDGRTIAFASARDGDYDLYLIQADGSNERVLLDEPGYQMYPAWSADGEWIAYESGPETIDGLQIRIVRPDGSGDRAVTDDAATNRFPAWSAEGRLAWSRSGELVVLDQLDGEVQALGDGGFPAWWPWAPTSTTC